MISRLGFALLSIMSVEAFAADINPTQSLMDQVIWGETFYRDDFVQHSLERLQLMNPNDPEVLAARIRLAIRQKNIKLANKLLDELKQKAPNSEYYRQAKMSFLLTEPSTMQKLQQARIMAMSGHLPEAKAEYDALFHGDFPTTELSAEYWNLVSRIASQRQNAFNHMQALYDFLKEHQIYTNATDKANWVFHLQSNLAGLWVGDGNLAFQAGNFDLAQKKYEHALELDKNNYFAWTGIGEIEFARKNFSAAEKAYKQALAISPGKGSAVYGLIGIYKRQSLQKAIDYLDSLPEDQKVKFHDARQSLESSLLQEQAERLQLTNQWQKAIAKYSEAEKIAPEDVWLVYHLAIALHHVGQTQKGDELFKKLIAKQKTNPTQIYAYALYLSSSDREKQALDHMHSLPQNKWDKNMRELAQRLSNELILRHAQKLRDEGNLKAAEEYLLGQPQTVQVKLTLADWFFNDNDFARALSYYQNVKKLELRDPDANLGVIESLIALGRKPEALELLKKQEHMHLEFNDNMQRRLANAWNTVGFPQKALAVFGRIKKRNINAAPSMDSALIFRDAARLETQLRQPKVAQQDYKTAMVKSKITSVQPTNNDTYTFFTRNNASDDWLKRSIRVEAAQLYQQQETRITIHEDYWRLRGTPGTSDMRAEDVIAQADWGYSNGRAFFRADKVKLGAGQFTTINGVYADDFGTCKLYGCSSGMIQRTNGIGWDGGWQNAIWGFDVGETPLNFPVTNWIGGVNYSGDFHHIGWTITASQRPMTNSLLSFSGTIDPATGIKWGGVVATGLTLSLSYDRGEAHGFWANIIGSELTGKNVVSNQRILLMEGYYYKIINEENRRLIIGLTNMVWHYDKNLYGFNLGQGGYYSPDFYVSLTLPIDYRKRTGNWSYELGGTVTWSYARTGSMLTYPIPGLIPNFEPNQNSVSNGGNGPGYGFSLLALVERRLSSHFILGGLANIQQSTDYTPSHLSLFLRYSFEGWQGDLDMPIVPLIPYSNFR